MKAEIHLIHRVASTLLVVAAAAFATGCVAQAGNDSEDSASTDQALTADQGAVVIQHEQQRIAPATVQRESAASPFTTTTVLPGANLEHANPGDNPTDPGGAVKEPGDGREPDPHPWRCSVQAAAR